MLNVVDEPSLVLEAEVQQGFQIVPLLIESTVVLEAFHHFLFVHEPGFVLICWRI